MTVVACCQFAPELGALHENVARTLILIEKAVERGAEIVVLPELANSGYAFADSAEAAVSAEPRDGATVQAWQRSAEQHGIVIVAGFCEAGEQGKPYNSAAILAPGQAPTVYRKAHLWDRERLIFAPGDAHPPVVQTEHGRISTVICYDLEFPEWVRIPALAGAELICAPVNWPDMGRPAGERPGEVVRAQAQAAMNRVAVAACDRAGIERGVTWSAASAILDADGWPRALADHAANGEEILFARIDLAESRTKKIAEYSDVIADRRTDLY